MEPALLTLARAQGGVFTTPQAHRLGIGDVTLTRMRRTRVIRPVARSVSVLAEAWPAEPEGRLAVRTRGALALYPDSRAVGASLLCLGAVPIHGVDVRRADIARPVHREVLTDLCRIRPSHGVLRPSSDQCLPAAVLAGAIVQIALDHGHLAAVVAADHALRRQLLRATDIERAAECVVGWPASGRVRTMLEFMDGRAESVGETRLRLFVRALGWAVTPQLPLEDRGGRFGFADLGVDGTNLLLEFDGRVKYGEDSLALWKEKQREDRARRRGYVFERVIWADLERPPVLWARLQHARANAGPPPAPWQAAG